MYRIEDQEKLDSLCHNNKELSDLLKLYDEEQKFLLSRITHEVRNPLTLIYSTLQLMQKKNAQIADSPYWSSIMEDMKDVFTLLEQLSDYNHSDTLQLTTVSLYHLITDLKISFESMCSTKNVSLTLKFGKAAHHYIDSYQCDYIKLKQVLTNIVKNALEAVHNGGHIQISVNGSYQQDNQDYFCILISNDGPQIESDDLNTIFTPFITTKANGTGLGLATANRIIRSHNGFIEVDSTKKLTTFYIYLPSQN